MPERPLRKETETHRDAYEYYYSLGGERSLYKVAQRFHVSTTAVGKWARSFGWDARIGAREAEVAAQVERQVVNQQVDRKVRNLRIVDAALAQFVKALREERIKIESMRDLDVLLKLEAWVLEGMPDESTSNPMVKLANQLSALREMRQAGGSE